MPRGASCSLTSKAITIGGGSTPLSATSPRSRQTGKPHNLVSTVPGGRSIDILCANSPQAKGRVERAFGTLQDRLVKELRLAGISTVEAANAWLPGFIEDYNKRFGRTPANAKDLHRPLTQADDLDEILAWRE